MASAMHNNGLLAGKRALVTGGSGFLGSHMVERLLQEGAIVGALARSTGKLAEIPQCGRWVFLACDLTDAKRTRETIGSFAPQLLFHFASHPDGREHFDRATAAVQGNIMATLNTLEAFRLCAGELFVYGDSCKVYGDSDVPYREAMPMKPISSYAIAKAAGWEFCQLYRKLYGLATVSVRPTLIYGPRQSYNLISYVAERVLDQAAEVLLDGGTQTRDLLFVEDAMDAFVAIARLGAQVAGRIINIGGGNEQSVSDLAAMTVGLMGGRAHIVSAPARTRPTEMQRSYCDNVEAQRILGWQPRTDMPTGLERTLQYLMTTRAVSTAVGS